MATARGRAEDGYLPELDIASDKLVEGRSDKVAADANGPLPEYFDTRLEDGYYVLRCKKCPAAFRLLQKSTHIGNRQKLLAHARLHSDLEVIV